MTNPQIIALIDTEISRLQAARKLLTAAPAKRGPGRPKGASPLTAASVVAAIKPARKVRVLSPEAKARIAAAQKKRWAKHKAAAKKAAKKTA